MNDKDISVGVLYPWTGLPSMDRGAARRLMPLVGLLAERFGRVTVLSPEAGPFRQGGVDFVPVLQTAAERVFIDLACRLYEGLTYHGLPGHLEIRSRRQWWHFIRPLLHGSLRRSLRRVGAQSDVLLLEYPFWSRVLADATAASPKPVILTLLDLLSGICKNPWLAERVHRCELAASRRAQAVVCVTEEEARRLGEAGVEAVYIPHGFVFSPPGQAAPRSADDPLVGEIAQRAESGGVGCFFLGSSLIPNREAVEAVLEMARKCSSVENLFFVTAGSCCGHGRPAPNMYSLGPVSEGDLLALYSHCRIVLAPLESGTGASTKVIEALGKRRVLVTTRVGIRGYDGIRDGAEAVVCDNLSDWPAALERLAGDPGLCARLIAGGEAFAKTFDYRTVYQPYLDLISKWGGRSL